MAMAKKTKKGKITIDRDLCKGCYLCISVCPNHLIAISDKLNQKGYYPAEYIETDGKEKDRKCTGCALCAMTCPDIAIEVYRG
jgi:2-oxoglutarate ferredoxin oxidoreductase subunit delta